MTVRQLRPLGEPPAALGRMQAEFPAHSSPDVGQPVRGVPDQRAPLETQGERASVGRTLPPFGRFEPVQLATVPLQGRHAQQAHVVRGRVPAYPRIRQAPGIDAVRTPHLRRFLARFLEAKLLSQLLGFPSLFGLDRCQCRQLGIKPVLADFQRGKTSVPTWLACRLYLDVFDYEGCDGIERAEPATEPQFPLPARFRGRRQLPRVAQAIGARLSAGCLTSAARPAHLAALLDGSFDPIDGVSLDIEIGMGGRDDAVAFLFGAWVNAHSDRLHLSRRGLDIESDTEDPALPERGRLAALDPAPCPGRGRRHQELLVVINHWDKHGR